MSRHDVTLRREQLEAVASAVGFLRSKRPTRKLFASATGTGKSYLELETLRQVPGGVLLSPSNDIIIGLLTKLGVTPAASETRLRQQAARHNIYTPLYFRNRLLAGELDAPKYLIWDEVHHQTAESWSDVSLLCGCPELGFTATPYRGTARGTADFKDIWGEPHWVYTYPQAVERGFCSLPEVVTVPLVDDDVIEVTNGEFSVKSVESATRSRLLGLARLIESYPLDRATMIACPTRATAYELSELVSDSVVVTGESSRAERDAAYADMLKCRKRLIQIAVVGEGVDLAVRRIFDAAPTLSPVRWVQLFGRLTRPCPACQMTPGGLRCHKCRSNVPLSEYICTNRNLLRHCYCLHGAIPTQQIAKSQAVFGLGERSGQRAFGLEGLGRFKANPLPLANGLNGELYQLENSDKRGTIKQVVCILHPMYADPLWATRTNTSGTYGHWEPCEAPQGFTGFSSGNGSVVTQGQYDWWTKAAAKYGLDAEHRPNRRTFAALPVLSQLGLVLET